MKRGLVEALNRTPYLDPREQAERQEKLEQIRQIRIVLDAIQFGVYYHRPEDPPTAHRYFSNEFEICRDDTISGELLFDYNRKLFRVEVRVVDLRSRIIVAEMFCRWGTALPKTRSITS